MSIERYLCVNKLKQNGMNTCTYIRTNESEETKTHQSSPCEIETSVKQTRKIGRYLVDMLMVTPCYLWRGAVFVDWSPTGLFLPSDRNTGAGLNTRHSMGVDRA